MLVILTETFLSVHMNWSFAIGNIHNKSKPKLKS